MRRRDKIIIIAGRMVNSLKSNGFWPFYKFYTNFFTLFSSHMNLFYYTTFDMLLFFPSKSLTRLVIFVYVAIGAQGHCHTLYHKVKCQFYP